MAFINFQPSDFFNTKLWTGDGTTSNAQTGIGFQPDLVWTKGRSDAYDNTLTDAARGATKYLISNSSNAEATGNIVTSFDSDGFTLGNRGEANNNNSTYVAWNWKANGQGSANSDGSITTTYTSANTTSGISIITSTGNKTSGATIGHGLGAVPKMIIGKRLDTTASWGIYHSALGATKYMDFNTAAAATSTAPWNDTEPTSSVITLGNWDNVNASSGSHVIYAFAEKKGFSKFGSYIGNGNADGTFVYTGFKPAFVLGKNATFAGQHWFMNDNKRGINGGSNWLKADGSDAELTNLVNCDFLSNGFKLRNNNDIFNDSGETLVYMAFAEEPLVSSNNIPATAR